MGIEYIEVKWRYEAGKLGALGVGVYERVGLMVILIVG